MVRRSERAGVVVRQIPVSAGFDRFLSLYRTTMRRIGASDYYFFNDRYFHLIKHLIENSGFLLVADMEGEWVAAAVFFYSSQFLHYHLSASGNCTPGATNAILHEAARIGFEKNLRCLHLGGGRTSDPDDTLLKFKLSCGSETHVFHIARTIHSPDDYSAMCEAWKRTFPGLGSCYGHRFLCYRERPLT